jgi:hypothetical protein
MPTIKHPSAKAMEHEAWSRFMKLQKQHARQAALLWLGTLAYEFNTEELLSIVPYMCERDIRMLQQIGKLPDSVRPRKASETQAEVINLKRPTSS